MLDVALDENVDIVFLQMYRLNAKGQVALGERCLDHIGSGVGIVYCQINPTGPWQWDKVSWAL